MDADETVNHFEAILRSEGKAAYEAAVRDLWKRNPKRAAALGLPEFASEVAADSLDSLLKIVADPKTYSAKLQSLKDAQDKIVFDRSKLAADREAHEKAVAAFADREKVLAVREKAADAILAREAQVAKREAAVVKSTGDLAGAAAGLDARKASLDDREAKLKIADTQQRNASAALDKRAADIAAAEADYKNRISSLRKLVG